MPVSHSAHALRRERLTTRLSAQLLLIVLGALALVAGAAASSQARYADTGLGRFQHEIDWIEWGADGDPFVSGSTATSTRLIDGRPFTIHCVATDVVGIAEAYRSGRWSGDALPRLYSRSPGGTDDLVAGIANRDDGDAVSFTVGCAADYDGMDIPIAGLVISDAESNNAAQGEYIQATPATPATWRLLDRYRTPGCTTSARADLAADGTLRLDSDGTECSYLVAGGQGPVAVAYMEGAQKADFELQGGGKSAIAIGAVIATDFGDAPVSYGTSGAFFQPNWVDGEIPLGTSNLFDQVATSELGQYEYGLGLLIDGEFEQLFSDDARGDDDDGVSDEDVEVPDLITVTRGETYTIDGIVCGAKATVAGWIDWNGSGSFDAADRSDLGTCATGTTALTWTVPDDAVSGTSFVRLRSAADAAQLASPTGMTPVGEVEDHLVTVFVSEPGLGLTKDAVPAPGTAVAPGDVVTYTVTATNTGNEPFDPSVVTDDLSGVLVHATYNDDARVRIDGTALIEEPELFGATLTWSGHLDPAQTVVLTYSVTVDETGTGTELVNVAAATGTTPLGRALTPPPASTVHPLDLPAPAVVPDPQPEPVDPEPGTPEPAVPAPTDPGTDAAAPVPTPSGVMPPTATPLRALGTSPAGTRSPATAAPTLPRTGVEVLGLTGAAVALLALGVATRVSRRRRA